MVHKYFKKEFDEFKILLQLNPVTYGLLELTIEKNGKSSKRKLTVDEEIFEDLAEDDFVESSSLEFNLYLRGLAT